MNRRAFLLMGALSFVVQVFAQDEITFKAQYHPDTQYSQTMESTSVTEIKYSGSEEFLNKLKGNGVQNPTISKAESTTESVMKTGQLTDRATFPLVIEFIRSTSSDGKKAIPDGMRIYGNGTTGSMPQLDSIVTEGLGEDDKQILLQTMQTAFSQISFPDKKMKVGDRLSSDSPVSLPIAGMTLDMLITTHYTLLAISHGMANFDVVQEYTMKATVNEYNLNATGTGKGTLDYDIANSFYLNYQMDIDMEMHMKIEAMEMSLKLGSGVKQTTVITKNPSEGK